jgi:hypothetical protein
MKPPITDVELLDKYRQHTLKADDMAQTIQILSDVFSGGGNCNSAYLDAIKLPVLKAKIEELFRYLETLTRFHSLAERLNTKEVTLEFSNTQFILGDRQFATLDEVERVANNRALL